ncbi:MAG: 4Fe-4S binding protein, partial [Alphaproteobacteria bacterium]
YSFRGTNYRRSGRFDRIQIVQDDRTLVLGADQQSPVTRLAAPDAPDLPETALFVLPANSGFDPTQPWRLDLLVAGEAAGAPSAVLRTTYVLPARYRLPDAPVKGSEITSVAAAEPGTAEPLWMTVWRARAVEIVVVCLAIVGVTAIFVFQDALVRRRRLYRWVRVGFMLFTLLALGWYAGAQLSVLNVLTFGDALRSGFRWEVFLVDPLLFILWSFTAVGLLFHARGVFCGWLCPFGALQELTGRLGRFARLPVLTPPFAFSERAWPIKYILFLGLFALSLGETGLTVQLAEIEPFKTAIVMHFDRTWPFVAYAAALLMVCLFVERFFCRYLCPLGGALAIPARLRMFDWLKRHWQCGLQCHICESRCPVQAISPSGQINPNECIQCLECQALYYDDTICPPMVERRRRREPKLTQTLVERFGAAEAKGEAQGEGGAKP